MVLVELAPGLQVAAHAIEERFVRASGPGGQNVNKVATAVELRFDIAASRLPADVQRRLRTLAANRISDDDILLIDSRAHRTQLANREAAHERLVELLQKASVKPKRRRATRPSAASRERRIESKKHRGAIKSQRRRRQDD